MKRLTHTQLAHLTEYAYYGSSNLVLDWSHHTTKELRRQLRKEFGIPRAEIEYFRLKLAGIL